MVVPAADRANPGKRVDPDQARFLNRLAPRFDVLQTALIDPLPFGVQRQPVRPAPLTLRYLIDPFLEPPLIVLERDIKHVTVDRPLVAEHKARFVRDRYAHVEGEPRFADFGLAREDRGALGNHVGQNDADRLELFRLKRFCGGQSFVPLFSKGLFWFWKARQSLSYRIGHNLPNLFG